MPPPADLILHNARIYTVDAARPTASALAVRDGRFVDVGASEHLLEAYPEARSIDADGHTVVPGFIDAHAHLQELGFRLRRADVSGTASPEEVVERLRAFAAERTFPSGAWLRGHGWDETEWDGHRGPSRAVLDEAFPEQPVWLTRADIHAGWANTAALEASVGVERLRRMDPPDGGAIRRDADGLPTGVLVDTAMDLVQNYIPPPTDTQQDRALAAALDHTTRHGLTGLHEAGVDLDTMRRFQRFIDEGRFPLRVYAMIDGRGATFDHFCDRGPYKGPHGRLQIGAVKFFADGALGSRGAALLDDYADASDNRGLLRQPPAQLQADVRAAVACGFQVCTHAIGDRANRLVLDAYEAAVQNASAPVRRPRIEHAQVLHPDDIPRFGTLGVLASVQPSFATSDWRWAVDRLGSNRIGSAYAWRSLQEAGAQLAFGSDAPVEPVDPLRGIHAAVTRQDADGQPPGGWRPGERVSRETALHAYTQGAAYAAFQEDTVGSITPGKQADFAVLSQDLMRVPMDDLGEIDVVATWVGGTPVHPE